MSKELVLVQTGTANVASVQAAFARLGVGVLISNDPIKVLEAKLVVLPGVGTFGAAMSRISQSGLVDSLKSRVSLQRPLCGICVGMQVLFSSSAESPGVAGLGVFEQSVVRFPDSVRVPQMGWNSIEVDQSSTILRPGFGYFANSFAVQSQPTALGKLPPICAAWADHGVPFVAAVQAGTLLGCQFHPELSGDFGAELLSRWLKEDV